MHTLVEISGMVLTDGIDGTQAKTKRGLWSLKNQSSLHAHLKTHGRVSADGQSYLVETDAPLTVDEIATELAERLPPTSKATMENRITLTVLTGQDASSLVSGNPDWGE